MDAVAAAHVLRARDLHRAGHWEAACVEYAAADVGEPLSVADLEAFAEAAQVAARGDEAVAVLHRVFDLRVSAGESDDAAQVAFWLWWVLLNTDQAVRANGWLEQTIRTLGPDIASGSWLQIPVAMRHAATGDRARAADVLSGIVDEARGEVVPWALGLWGHLLIEQGRVSEGLDRLDEAMFILGDVGLSPRVTPWVYCAAVGGCLRARDLARARAWNRSMASWLDSLSSLGGAYLGNCRIYRSRLMCIDGRWPEALAEVAAVCDDLTGFPGTVCGHAYYQLAEMHRLRGDVPAAEDAYRRAAELGCSTQPGLALLRLAEGDTGAAAAGIDRALIEASAMPDRLDLLRAAIAIHLESGQVEAARNALAELETATAGLAGPVVEAERAAVRGAVALADGDPAGALPLLRRAVELWQAHDAPHQVADLNVQIGRACQALDDQDGARLHFSAARETFVRLGARSDLIRLDREAADTDPAASTHRLTSREIEVLSLVARGRTNRAIATELHLSERTVHRHLSNILTKLGVDSRTAAVTYAIKHHIVAIGML